MPKLLLISYHFPPDAAVGAIRPAKFVKYLSQLGWNCYVLTVQEEYALARDWARLEEVADVPIVRTVVWPTALQLAVQLKSRLAGSAFSPASPERVESERGDRSSARLRRYVSSLFGLPDQQVGWLIPAVSAAYRLVKTEGIGLVITSSPPRTTALVGLLLSYLAPIRLVTDLRDPWFTPYLQDPLFKSLFTDFVDRTSAGDRIEGWLERKILERSARVITTTERCAVALRQAYHWLPEDRVYDLPNGYDAEDLASIGSAELQRKFTLSYLGTFYGYRTPTSFFEALSQLMREGKLSAADIEVNLIGNVRSTPDGSIEELIASYGLTDCVRCGEPLSYKASLRQMMQSHVLLLFAPKQCYSIPAKAFEYLATRKPILCLAQEGATADLINKTAAGIIVDPDDVGAIKRALTQLFEAFRRGQPLTNTSDVSRYERRVLSEQLSRLLTEIA